MAVLAPGLFDATGQAPQVYFETAAMIITLILLGRFLEARAKGQAADAIRRLLGLQPNTARIVRDGHEMEIPVAHVEETETSLFTTSCPTAPTSIKGNK